MKFEIVNWIVRKVRTPVTYQPGRSELEERERTRSTKYTERFQIELRRRISPNVIFHSFLLQKSCRIWLLKLSSDSLLQGKNDLPRKTGNTTRNVSSDSQKWFKPAFVKTTESPSFCGTSFINIANKNVSPAPNALCNIIANAIPLFGFNNLTDYDNNDS